MGIIQRLPELVANKIAAGEVIERPASVVKELVENSIDAGASRIEVLTQDAGKKRIVVSDDGCGMDAEDVRMAFEPHATSKIRTSDDLFYIMTKGFRGEALASIGAISECTLTSRQRGAPVAHRISVTGGKPSEVVEAGAPEGTCVEVRNLFFNTPARRRFLRSYETEVTHVVDTMRRIAIGHPEIAFSLATDSGELLRLAPTKDKAERIVQVFGREMGDSLRREQGTLGGSHLEVYLDASFVPRSTSRWLLFYVNRRPVADRKLLSVLRKAYGAQIPGGKFPAVFLFLEMDPRGVDVNVHPAKLEVRFQEEEHIHKLIVETVRTALRATGTSASVPVFLQSQSRDEGRALGFAARPLDAPAASVAPGLPAPAGEVVPLAELPYERFLAEEYRSGNFICVHGTYLVAETAEGIRVIDIHALHERILYDQFMERLSRGLMERQRLLRPEVIELPQWETELLLGNREELLRVGFEIESFGEGSVAVHAVPRELADRRISELVKDLLDAIGKGEEHPAGLTEKLVALVACKGAYKEGEPLSEGRCQEFLRRLGDVPRACPHGRPVFFDIPLADIERRLRRR